MKKKKMIRKMFTGLVILGLMLIIGTGAVSVLLLQHKNMENFKSKAYSYTRTAADMIDGDMIHVYLETGKKDAYYEEINKFLNVAAEEAGIKYFYVVIPTDEDLIYVWDAEPGDIPLEFLTHDSYSEGGEENTMRVFRGEDQESFELYLDADWFVATAMTPLYDSSGTPVAVIAADMSIPGIWESLLSVLLPLLGIIFVIMIAAIILYYFWMKRQVITPVTILEASTGNLIEHIETETDFQIPVYTNDELDDLARSYERMAGKLKDYIHENEAITAEKERIATELDLAARIQSDMLPTVFSPFPGHPEIDIYASMDPAKEVGGDFYDFFFIDEDKLAVVIADVSGKGIPAALFMMMSKFMIQNYTMAGLSPEEVLTQVNEQICRNNQEKMFVTVWLGILDIHTGRLTAVNAGHEYPMIRKPDGDFEILKDKHGFVIGGMEGMKYKQYALELTPGTKLFLYTDGAPEAKNGKDEFFGLDRLLRAVNQAKDEPPKDILANVQNTVGIFVGDAEQFDDLTMLCIEYKGDTEGEESYTERQ